MLIDFFTNLKIREKIRLTSWLASASALLLITLGYGYYQHDTLLKLTINNIAVTGKILATNVGDAIYNLDSDVATLQLASTEINAKIYSACLFDPDGKIFSYFLNSDMPGYNNAVKALAKESGGNIGGGRTENQACPYLPDFLPKLENAVNYLSSAASEYTQLHKVNEEVMAVSYPVVHRNKKYGSLYILFTTPVFFENIRDQALGLLLLFSIGMFISMLLADALQKNVSRPIVHLAGAMRRIAEEKNYSLRMTRTSNDETGVMIDQFNLMLNEVENRDRELLSHRINLENVVLQRTSEIERIRNEIQHSRDFLKRIIDNVPDPIFVKNHEYKYVMGNAAFWRLLPGHESNIGKTDYDFFPRPQADMVRLHDVETINNGSGLYEEKLLIDGKLHTFISNKVRTTGLDGKAMIVAIIHEKKL
jgi:PAS domain-containing protein